MKTRRSILLAAGAMLLASGAPVLAQKITASDYVAGVVARYVEPDRRLDFSQRYSIHEAGNRAGKIFRGATVTRRDSDVVISVPEAELFSYPDVSVHRDGVNKLTELASLLVNRDTIRLEVMAHYHSEGQPAHAMVESGRRATAIQGVLLSRGVKDRRVVASGLGEAWPLAYNDTLEGQAENRRIDFVIRSTR